MHVFAFSTARHCDWRWRIVDSAGDIVEESHDVFVTISAAVANGTARAIELSTS